MIDSIWPRFCDANETKRSIWWCDRALQTQENPIHRDSDKEIDEQRIQASWLGQIEKASKYKEPRRNQSIHLSLSFSLAILAWVDVDISFFLSRQLVLEKASAYVCMHA
jgi:hypothetical protein